MDSFPYPDAEHVPVPRTCSHIIDRELRLYPDTESFRTSLLGLHHVYNDVVNAPIMVSMQQHAIMCSNVRVLLAQETVKNPVIDPDFYNGEVFGIHVASSLAPNSTVRSIALRKCPVIAVDDEDDRVSAARQRFAVFESLLSDPFDRVNQSFTSDHAASFHETLARYAPVELPDALEARKTFAAGYILAINLYQS